MLSIIESSKWKCPTQCGGIRWVVQRWFASFTRAFSQFCSVAAVHFLSATPQPDESSQLTQTWWVFIRIINNINLFCAVCIDVLSPLLWAKCYKFARCWKQPGSLHPDISSRRCGRTVNSNPLNFGGEPSTAAGRALTKQSCCKRQPPPRLVRLNAVKLKRFLFIYLMWRKLRRFCC